VLQSFVINTIPKGSVRSGSCSAEKTNPALYGDLCSSQSGPQKQDWRSGSPRRTLS
jgi:hypothetical protein